MVTNRKTLVGAAAGSLGAAVMSEAALIRLGLRYGSTAAERGLALPGDEIVLRPNVVTNHAITIHASAEYVWPWLVQMGWGRAQWYTARWVDRLLFPNNGPSAERIQPEWQHLEIGDFIPDGRPETKTGLIVEDLQPNQYLVLRSTSHIPLRWRDRAALDWTWVFVLTPSADGRHTRFLFRSRWATSPWWLTAGGWLGIVPADFVMSRDMLRGVKRRAEALTAGMPGQPRAA